MRKIINGKLYNTETAKELGLYARNNPRDFGYLRETLYRKITGEYFLYGYGGPNTKYAEQIDSNTFGYGDRFMPMTEAEAKAWAEDHMDTDEYIAAFGAVEE